MLSKKDSKNLKDQFPDSFVKIKLSDLSFKNNQLVKIQKNMKPAF